MTGFEPWYRSHHPQLLAALTLLTKDVDEASEVAAEAFSLALERWHVVEGMANPAGWTYGVAVNLLRRRWRRQRRERTSREGPYEAAAPALGEARLDVYRAVQSLPNRRGRR